MGVFGGEIERIGERIQKTREYTRNWEWQVDGVAFEGISRAIVHVGTLAL